MKTLIKRDWLAGKWECDSSVILEITIHGNSLRVRAFDRYDDEEFVVSRIKWDGKCLRFETYVPSTKYRTRNALTPISKNKLIQELTLWESWKKISLKAKYLNQGDPRVAKASDATTGTERIRTGTASRKRK